MNLVIVAGGLGSRLAPLTNYIPKFLVNIGKETGFVKMLEYWRQYQPSSITVIVHSRYKDLTQAYFDLYFKDDAQLRQVDGNGDEVPTPFIIKTVDEANGSAHAIMTTCQHLEKQPVLFTWCDVIPAEPFDVEELNNGGALAFTNYDYPNRYDLIQPTTEPGAPKLGWSHRVPAIREDGRGGLFGVYYVSTFEQKPYQNGQDFVEVLKLYSHNGFVNEVKMPSIIDFGDMPKLERVRSTADAARSFNSVEFHGDLVLKSALNAQGEGLIKREVAWYNELNAMRSTVRRPMHWSNPEKASFVMTKVKGVPVWQQWPKLDAEGRRMVLTRIFDELDKMHEHKKPVGYDQVQLDIKTEAYDKLIARYDEIKPLIDAFGPVQWVVTNGAQYKLKCLDPKVTIKKLFDALIAEYDTPYHSLIHGDLQMSNTMIDPATLEVTFIDPRGYFGKTTTYGCADYDIAKLLYSLSGYDLFNYSKDFHLKHNGLGEVGDGSQQWFIEFNIEQPSWDGCQQIIADRFKRVHRLWLAVIWIGLAQYIKNDPVKSVAAHYHGLVMAESAQFF
jgi:Phosphotransferase enzyme family/MobA-like NTP transferase domain